MLELYKQTSLLLFVLLATTVLQAQIATELFVPCYGTSGCVVDSEILVTGGTVEPPGENGGPGIIYGDGAIIEVCYTQLLHVSLGMNWHQGTEAELGPGWEPINAGSGVSGPGGGASGAGNYVYYDYMDNCPGQGPCGSAEGWGWYYESGQNVQCGGSPGDGDASNNYGDYNVGGQNELEFCFEFITECDGASQNSIDTQIDFLVYAHSEIGTWNTCGCEGGAIECSIEFNIVCCDVPDIEGIVADANCADVMTELSASGDTSNPNYTYNWQGPDGPGPQGVNQSIWSFLPGDASEGEYTLTVTNTADDNCEMSFNYTAFAGGQGADFDGTDVFVGSEEVVTIYPDEDASLDGQFGGPLCASVGVNCGEDPITGVPYVEIDPVAIQANSPGAPGSAGTCANLIYSVGNSQTPCFAFSTQQICFLGGPPAPEVVPSQIDVCTDPNAPFPSLAIIPNEGWEYHWYQVPAFGVEQAIIATGTASLTDWPTHINPGIEAPDGGPYLIYVTAVDQATGAYSPFTEIEVFVGNCQCYESSTLIQAEGEITLCGDASASDITSVLNDLEGSSELDVNFFCDADPDGDGVSNTITFEYEYDGNNFNSATALAATLIQDSNADLCEPLEAEISLTFQCSSQEGQSGSNQAGAVTFILYPDLEDAILDGDAYVEYEATCDPGTCLPILIPNCLETTSLYDLTYSNTETNQIIAPFNCSTISSMGTGTLTIHFETNDPDGSCADPIYEGITFSCDQGVCDEPDIDGIFADANCADLLTELSVSGDTGNPNYSYNWLGPNGPGPQGVNQPTWTFNLGDAITGIYTLTVTNTTENDCFKEFALVLYAGGDGVFFTAEDACVGAEGYAYIYPAAGSSLDGQFGGPACSIPGVTCGNDSQTGIPYVEFDQPALTAITPGNPGSLGTCADLMYSLGDSMTPCFAFNVQQICFSGVPAAPTVIPAQLDICANLTAPFPGISVSPNGGWEYHWYQVPTFGLEEAEIAVGTASLTDWPSHINPEISLPNGAPYLLYVAALNQATGCLSPFTEIEVYVDNCTCYEPSTLVQAEGAITLCGDASASDISGVLTDLEGNGDLNVNFEVDADHDGDGIENTITFEYDYAGNSFTSATALASTIIQDSNADLCNVLEAEVFVSFNCNSQEGLSESNSAGIITFTLYPDLQNAILDGDVSVVYDDTCASGTCLPTLVPNCLETTSLYDLTYTLESGGEVITPFNCNSLSNIGEGSVTIVFDTSDPDGSCADPILDGIAFDCDEGVGGGLVLGTNVGATISPNPNTGTLFVHVTKKQSLTYRILDLNGRVIQFGQVKDSRIDFGEQSAGIYFLELLGPKGSWAQHKIVKE